MPCDDCSRSRANVTVSATVARAATLVACSAACAFLPAFGDDGPWTRIATENSSFSVDGTQTVRYGSGDAWITKSVTGGGQCTNAFFGTDPAYGIVKACEVAATAATGWTRIATEWESFSVSGTQT